MTIEKKITKRCEVHQRNPAVSAREVHSTNFGAEASACRENLRLKSRFAILGPSWLMEKLPAAPAPTASITESGFKPALPVRRGCTSRHRITRAERSAQVDSAARGKQSCDGLMAVRRVRELKGKELFARTSERVKDKPQIYTHFSPVSYISHRCA